MFDTVLILQWYCVHGIARLDWFQPPLTATRHSYSHHSSTFSSFNPSMVHLLLRRPTPLSLLFRISLSVLTAIFQMNLGWPVFIEAKDDGGGGDNWTTGAISRAKLQSNHHHQQTNIQYFYRPDALPVAQPTVSKQAISQSMDLLIPSSPGSLPTLSLTTNSSWLPCGMVAMPLISPLMPVPHLLFRMLLIKNLFN